MATSLEHPAAESTQEHVKQPLSWFREQQEAIRKRNLPRFEFTPIKIKGESLSQTIIRERRGDFDNEDDPLS
jgi:hypothetical protein